MIIFINGSFGVGKSTLAEKLVERIPNSLLYDPEMAGYYLRAIVGPIDQFDDFQDLAIWRPLVVTTARLLQQTYGRTLIMPMTIWNTAYFDEIMSGLRAFEPQLFHFCLIASKETIYQRLHSRPNSAQASAWVAERIDRCIAAFQSPRFKVQVATDNSAPDELVEEILRYITLSL